MSVELLKEAETIMRQRGQQYGRASDTFGTMASISQSLTSTETTAWESAMHMLSVKLSRITYDPTHRDSYVDAINYLCIAFALATDETKVDRHDVSRRA